MADRTSEDAKSAKTKPPWVPGRGVWWGIPGFGEMHGLPSVQEDEVNLMFCPVLNCLTISARMAFAC